MPIRKRSRFNSANTDAIKSEIQRVAALTEGRLTREFLLKNSELTPQLLRRTFGSFEKAVAAAGLRTYRVATSNFDPKAIIAKIQALAVSLGYTPTQQEFYNTREIPRSAINKHFGTYNKAVLAAGLDPRKEVNIDEERLLFQVLEVFGKVKGVPNRREWAYHARWKIGPIVARWGNLSEAVLAAFTHFGNSTIKELIASGEGQELEFKETAKWDIDRTAFTDIPGKMVVKTVAAFANSDGGSLFIGINDRGEAVGLDRDMATFSEGHNPHDGFEQYLHSIILQTCGTSMVRLYTVSFLTIDHKDVCRISVSPSKTAIFVTEDKANVFYARQGNTTRTLETTELVKYSSKRF
jgi:hypothetical protein